MKRKHILAAELYSYSFENYRNHLGIGNIRFDRLMPDSVELFERAEFEDWPDDRIAREFEVELSSVPAWKEKYARAKAITNARNPAEAFRLGVRFSIEDALEDGLSSSKDIENLVTQICYRASDMSVLLEIRNETLSKYSDKLREEP